MPKMKRSFLILLMTLSACELRRPEQTNFYVILEDRGKSVNDLARSIGAKTGMKVFYGKPTNRLDNQRELEVYGDSLSIDIISVPCDSFGGVPNVQYSATGFFVTIVRTKSGAREPTLEEMAQIVQKETTSMGGRISKVAPRCAN